MHSTASPQRAHVPQNQSNEPVPDFPYVEARAKEHWLHLQHTQVQARANTHTHLHTDTHHPIPTNTITSTAHTTGAWH
eukprot:1160034-Pelagomonas_calceolata.AAC.4